MFLTSHALHLRSHDATGRATSFRMTRSVNDENSTLPIYNGRDSEFTTAIDVAYMF